MGMDRRRLRAVRRLDAAAVVSGILGRFLRRRSLRHEGRLSSDRHRPPPGRLPELVPPTVSLHLRGVRVREDDVGRRAFGADRAETLAREPRQISSKYFYDELGSALFEAITRLPWYRITRAETAMLARHARDIFDPRRGSATLAELGCGSGDKIAVLVAPARQ